jgi:hypothetical protein
VRLRAFVTSRPDLPIRLGFTKIEGDYQDLVLHEVALPIIEHDIAAFLSYLSACSTAENRAKRLSDEVIHLVSGFLVAGFPHVVGCLWPSNGVCVEVAGGFYSSLFEQGGSRWQDGQMAVARQN